MKPEMQWGVHRNRGAGEERKVKTHRFPRSEYRLQSGADFSGGFASPYDDSNRRFYNLSRECLAESAREQKCELLVLSLIGLACAWPFVAMILAVLHLYGSPHP